VRKQRLCDVVPRESVGSTHHCLREFYKNITDFSKRKSRIRTISRERVLLADSCFLTGPVGNHVSGSGVYTKSYMPGTCRCETAVCQKL